MAETHDVAEQAPPRGRLVLGTLILGVGFLCPALVPVVTASGLPAGWKATLSGLLLLGIPELFMLAAVAVLGKPGYAYLKRRVLGLVRRHVLPPQAVSRRRYRLGLVLFLIPLLWGWLTPYVAGRVAGYEGSRILLGVLGDAVLLASFLVLGGEFWDKLKALFVHEARAQLP